MMCADAGFHADQARRNIREPRFHLTTLPLLPQRDCAPVIETHDVERVLADIDADHGNRSVEFLRHGVLLALVAPMPALLPGGAGARPDHSITGIRSGKVARDQWGARVVFLWKGRADLPGLIEIRIVQSCGMDLLAVNAARQPEHRHLRR
jgi:hypothetical protein